MGYRARLARSRTLGFSHAASSQPETQAARLVNRVQTHRVFATIRATVQVSVGAATALRNRGSATALIQEIRIDENGTPRITMDGPTARFATEMFAPSALDAARAGVAVATYQLEEMVCISAASLLQLEPRETAYMERDPEAALELAVKLKPQADWAAALFTVGGATVAVTDVSVTVSQELDQFERKLPLFQPRVRQVVHAINGVNPNELVYLKSSNYLRAMVVKQETTGVGEVDDIIAGLALRGDAAEFIGPDQVRLDDLQLISQTYFGGSVYVNPTHDSFIGFNFPRHGRLTDVLAPSQITNLRLDLNVAPSASAGSSLLRITLFELERDLYVDPASGRRIVAEELPFTI